MANPEIDETEPLKEVEDEEDDYVVIDGQQRLKTIQFFYDGNFSLSTEEIQGKLSS